MKNTFSFAALAAAGLAAMEQPVHAYLDPGSGSMLLQILLGGFAAIGVAAKLCWHRLAARFGRKPIDPAGTGASTGRTGASTT